MGTKAIDLQVQWSYRNIATNATWILGFGIAGVECGA
jgi:hypothetical protein